MGAQGLHVPGRALRLDTPHNILPKPYGVGHPPIWVACGSPSTFGKAGSLGIGALGFNFSPIDEMRPQIEAYKAGIAECTEPVGQFVNDNVMITNAVICMEDGDRAREIMTREASGYLYSLVCLYHDTFPVPEGAIVWPEAPRQLDRATVDLAIEYGGVLCGTPDEVNEQLAQYADVGVDQLVFGLPNNLEHDEAMECIELFGDKVIPNWDPDPVHRTTRMRPTAKPKYGPFEHEPPAIETIFTRRADPAGLRPQALGGPVPELGLEDLAAGVQRQGVDDLDVAGRLVVGHRSRAQATMPASSGAAAGAWAPRRPSPPRPGARRGRR